ncbi:MAG TPA: hypothetical protein VGE38_05180 [Nocardioides sp.]|uniref:divisome protein SepX/GlpR n=1 Tax=Nocardioides sp. TaxID=35761 RepID=UPI002ED9AF87
MDPSALIFVALAVAWAAYLLPKALEHHEAGARSRTVDRFSHTMRVLARREPVSRRATRLVRPGESLARPVSGSTEAPHEEAVVDSSDIGRPGISITDTGSWALAQDTVRRSAAAAAARRRRRVLGVLLLLTAMVGSCAAGRVIHWAWLAAPLVLLVAWLVACRLMVRSERAHRPAARRPASTQQPAQQETAGPSVAIADDDTTEVPVVPSPRGEESTQASAGSAEAAWAPVPVTLPTYVSKPAAHRTVSTIDLDATGVWTSGNTAADSALAREADAVRAAAQQQPPAVERRVAGS